MDRTTFAQTVKRTGVGAFAGTTTVTAVVIGSMKGLAWAQAVLGTAMLSMFLSAHPAATGIGVRADIDPAIVAIANGYAKAVLAKDASAVAAYYRDDGVELPYCFTAVKGRAAIEQRFRTLFNSPATITAFTLSHDDTTVKDDTAYSVGSYTQRWSLPDGKSATEVGKFVAILKRTQGQWKLAYLIYNTDAMPAFQPLPTNR